MRAAAAARARRRRWADIVVAAVAANAVALAGGLLTDLGPWYQALREPSWKPPDMAFGPIWTVIFALTAIAAILAMIPLSESAFWGPMALTIMGGLSLATFMTLFLLPAIYALWFRKSLGPKTASAPKPEAPHPHFGAMAPAE